MEQTCEAEPTAVLTQECPKAKRYGGIRRLGYFLGMLGAGTLYEVCNTPTGSQFGVASAGSLIAIAISFILAVNRLRNIGMDGWAVMLVLVPLANIYIGIKFLICQEGYENVKKLDTTGRLVVGVLIAFILLVGASLLLD